MESIEAMIVRHIIEDLEDRAGLGSVWNEIDDEIKFQIILEWRKIISDALEGWAIS
jgi:hypothetical protein